MEQRISVFEKGTNAMRALYGVGAYLAKSSIERPLLNLICFRVSQINGCAYCVNHHTKEARRLGETEPRAYLISVWREAPNVFNDEERLLLEMTEEITLIHHHGLSDRLYEKAIQLLGEVKTAQVIMAIITINAWNRIGVSLNMAPQL